MKIPSIHPQGFLRLFEETKPEQAFNQTSDQKACPERFGYDNIYLYIYMVQRCQPPPPPPPPPMVMGQASTPPPPPVVVVLWLGCGGLGLV